MSEGRHPLKLISTHLISLLTTHKETLETIPPPERVSFRVREGDDGRGRRGERKRERVREHFLFIAPVPGDEECYSKAHTVPMILFCNVQPTSKKMHE